MDMFSIPDSNTAREVKAKYIHGKLEPMEELDLSEGEEVTIWVERPAKRPDEVIAWLSQPTGGGAGSVNFDSFLAGLQASRRPYSPDSLASLFGILKRSVTIKGDIISPIDVEWDASR